MKDQSLFVKGGEGKVKTIRRALKETIELGKNTATRKNQLKKRKRKSRSEVGKGNVVRGKRGGRSKVPDFVPPPEPPEGTITNIDELFEMEEKEIGDTEKGKKGKREEKGGKGRKRE